jgi:hypothetical protein
MDDDEIKKEFLAKIDTAWLNDNFLLTKLKDWIEEAVYQWPKGAILTDWKAITQIVKLVFQLKWKLKDNSQINIINAFGKTDITL